MWGQKPNPGAHPKPAFSKNRGKIAIMPKNLSEIWKSLKPFTLTAHNLRCFEVKLVSFHAGEQRGGQMLVICCGTRKRKSVPCKSGVTTIGAGPLLYAHRQVRGKNFYLQKRRISMISMTSFWPKPSRWQQACPLQTTTATTPVLWCFAGGVWWQLKAYKLHLHSYEGCWFWKNLIQLNNLVFR